MEDTFRSIKAERNKFAMIIALSLLYKMVPIVLVITSNDIKLHYLTRHLNGLVPRLSILQRPRDAEKRESGNDVAFLGQPC